MSNRNSAKIIWAAILLGASIVFLGHISVHAGVAEDHGITFPIAELNNCASEGECRAYCDDAGHADECFAFALAHDLMSEEEVEEARKFLDLGVGPGECSTPEECEAYCNDLNHINECLSFAEEHDLISGEELDEAKKVQDALARGAKLPGECKNKDECEAYCSEDNFDHMEECMAFALEAGFMSEDEAQEAEKFLSAIERGIKPPPCRGEDECEDYCSEPGHIDECVVFAEAAGFITPEEAEMMRLTGGKGPGGCQGRECETYCDNPDNFETCMEFAIEYGLVDEHEAEIMRKTGGKGPGGCQGRECETYCNDPKNRRACFEFAVEHDLVDEAHQEEIEKGKHEIIRILEEATPDTLACLRESLGEDFEKRAREEDFMPGPEMGDVMRKCFESFAREMQEKFAHEIRNAPPEVADCVEEEFGGEVYERVLSGDIELAPDLGDRLRRCFESHFAPPEGSFDERANHQGFEERGDDDHVDGLFRRDHDERDRVNPEEIIREQLMNVPVQARPCIERMMGPDFVKRIMGGEIQPQDIAEKCLHELHGEERRQAIDLGHSEPPLGEIHQLAPEDIEDLQENLLEHVMPDGFEPSGEFESILEIEHKGNFLPSTDRANQLLLADLYYLVTRLIK